MFPYGVRRVIMNIKPFQITKTRRANSFLLETSYGNESTPSASVFMSGKRGDWTASLAAEIFNTDGYGFGGDSILNKSLRLAPDP